ncbi:MAG: Endolytic transglycosylase MltG [Candidatus Saccharibacteria bacterium]|nr:Endolytic transglycosylase MltG [Candidatus Saccharibacteria bacterium]
MTRYHLGRGTGGRSKRIWWVLLGLVLLIAASSVFIRHSYTTSLLPVSNSEQTQIFTVASGSSFKTVAAQLETKKLVRSAWALELYVHSQQLGDKLQAGTYALSPSQGTKTIVSVLTKGKVATRLVTILPGRRIDQVRADLINDGFAPDAVDRALNPATYSDDPTLAFKPEGVTSLEGLLWPDSFQRDQDTDPSVIVRQSLDLTAQKVTPELQAAFVAQGLTVYQGLTLSSIVEQEVSKPADRAQAAQVFLKRLKTDMPLGSDVTAFYGSIAAGKTASLTYDSPYNTLIHKGLPPTPISSVSLSSLNAVANPANTDWLYFVAGDDGTTYFSNTLEEHQALTQKYCTKLCNASN